MYWLYIQWVANTSKVTIHNKEVFEKMPGAVVGFWHGNSLGMNLLLKEVQEERRLIEVIVTADTRGNYIEWLLRQYGAGALRMPDGARLRPFLQQLKEAAAVPNHFLCVALDGPLGPYQEPKKLGFMLAHTGEKPVVLVKASYSRKVHLWKRWDNYIVPLPYGEIVFDLVPLGGVEPDQLRAFDKYKQIIKEQMQ